LKNFVKPPEGFLTLKLLLNAPDNVSERVNGMATTIITLYFHLVTGNAKLPAIAALVAMSK